MKKLLFILLITVSFVSCKTCEPITIVRDSIRTERQYERDSIYFYTQDSVFIKEKGDTIYVDKWHLRYRDKIVEVHDTINVVEQNTNTVVTYQMNRAQKCFFWIGIIALIILFGYVFLKIFKRFYLR